MIMVWLLTVLIPWLTTSPFTKHSTTAVHFFLFLTLDFIGVTLNLGPLGLSDGEEANCISIDDVWSPLFK